MATLYLLHTHPIEYAHTCVHTHMYRNTHTHTHTYRNKQTHTHTYRNKHKHTHTHTHTHTPPSLLTIYVRWTMSNILSRSSSEMPRSLISSRVSG